MCSENSLRMERLQDKSQGLNLNIYFRDWPKSVKAGDWPKKMKGGYHFHVYSEDWP